MTKSLDQIIKRVKETVFKGKDGTWFCSRLPIDVQLKQAHQAGRENEEKRVKRSIGFLRQALNENKITDRELVTNKEIEEWLFNFNPTKRRTK